MDNKIYEDFLKYVKILDRIDVATENNEILSFTPEEREAVRRVQVAAGNNPDLGDLLKRIKECSSEERQKIVDEYFKNKDKPKNEEEEIAKVYGVDPRNIESKRLSNGKEIFSFYDYKLNRLVVLENNKNGKSLTEYLEEIQNENEQYQSEDDLDNANSIMDDQRKKTSMELEMVSVKEIGDHQSEIDALSDEDKRKIDYLIGHAEQLGVKEINIENQIYVDADNHIKEVVLDKEMKVQIAEPESENYENVGEAIEPETIGAETVGIGAVAGALSAEAASDNNDLDAMFADNEIIENVSPAKFDSFEDFDEKTKQAVIAAYEDSNILNQIEDPAKKQDLENKIGLYKNYLEKTNQKPKVFTKVDNAPGATEGEGMDELGIINNVIFVLLMALIITCSIIGFIYFT